MFTTAHGSGTRGTATTAYRDVGASTAVEGANQHKLVSLLYRALSDEVTAARGAVRRSDVREKGRAISHAVRIIEEGLRAPLDMTAGGAIAQKLNDLYEYIVYRLTVANLKSDDAALQECARLVDSLQQAWEAIASQIGPDRPSGVPQLKC